MITNGMPRITLGLVLFGASWQSMALEPAVLFEKVSPSVFIVRALNQNESPIRQGSGVLTSDKTITTSCHIIAKAKMLQIKQGGVFYLAQLEHADIERDLCQLKVPDLKAPVVTIAPSMNNLRIGQRIYAIGAKNGFGLTLNDGHISALRGGDHASIQTSIPTSAESSGGGLFDEKGVLLGIASKPESQKNDQILYVAQPAEWIAQIPQRAKAQLEVIKASKTEPAAQQALTSPPVPEEQKNKVVRLTAAEITQHISRSSAFVIAGNARSIFLKTDGWWTIPLLIGTSTVGTWTMGKDGSICLVQTELVTREGFFSGCYFAEKPAQGPISLVERKKPQ
ncbi:MAG: trypsin-like peptidase domain-containing protein [Zoogloeaceae bacterium]|nr:trypsin-like peptidase domain-containing protein [Zoogloeaceae bacterium]